MKRETIITVLREHEPELRAAGIVRLALFGSAARRQASSTSDIDLLAAFDEAKRISLLDVVHLENRLSDLLGQKVDLVEENMLRQRTRDSVARDLIRAF